VKAFKPNNLVTADDVRALLGVLMADGASKGFDLTWVSWTKLCERMSLERS
jgi:Integrase core domain